MEKIWETVVHTSSPQRKMPINLFILFSIEFTLAGKHKRCCANETKYRFRSHFACNQYFSRRQVKLSLTLFYAAFIFSSFFFFILYTYTC